MSVMERPATSGGERFKRSYSHAIGNGYNQVEVGPKFEVKKRTLQNSVSDYQKNPGRNTARTNYVEGENPENNYRSQIGNSVYVKQKSLPKKLKSKYAGAGNLYQDLKQRQVVGGECVLENTEKETLRKLVAMSIKHHDPTLCVCAYCTCGRHLCKIHPWKPPGVKPLSIYKKDYTKKTPFEDLKFRPSTSYKDNGPGIDPLSTYTKDYPPKEAEFNPKFLPTDLLQTGGPFSGLTTYGTGFPGCTGPKMQSVLPIGGQVLHGFPFSGKTQYKKDFTPKDAKPMEQIKAKGNLKTGQPWIGSSTYRDNFLKPNNTYNTGWKSNLSNIPDPKYANQHDTTYRTDYIPMGSAICPAIPQLLSRSRFFGASKNQAMMRQSKRALSKIKCTS